MKKLDAMSRPQEMPEAERKRQYAALGRSMKKDCPPALASKFKMSGDNERSLGQPNRMMIASMHFFGKKMAIKLSVICDLTTGI